MKIWRIEKHGGPEVLKRLELCAEESAIHKKSRAMEVLVRVEAVGLNHLDLWVRKGVTGHRFPLPLTPGCDIAGVIEAFGPGAREILAQYDLIENSPVLINPMLSCGRCEACLSGYDPLCVGFGILGETRNGGCADHVLAPALNLLKRPTGLSAIEAAALPTNFITAWSMLLRKAKAQPGEAVLVRAGGSAVSIAAIQIAKMLGCVVITTVGSEEKAKKARELGADLVIEYNKFQVREELKKFLSGIGKKGCEIVLDHTGAENFQESLKSLAWGGRFVTCGATSGAEVILDLKPIFFKNISVLGSTMGSKADLIRIVDLVSLGKLKPVIDSTFHMEELPAALERLEKRSAFGKIIVVNSC